MGRRLTLNHPGPHRRDIDRFIRECEQLDLSADEHEAQTGTVYVSVYGIEFGKKRVYRFAAHAEAYNNSHHYSVWSGGGASRRIMNAVGLPPGYDGLVMDAVRDLRVHAEQGKA